MNVESLGWFAEAAKIGIIVYGIITLGKIFIVMALLWHARKVFKEIYE